MTYYIIQHIGDSPIVDAIDNYSFSNTLFETDGKFFITDTYTDIDNEIREFDVQVYPSKREAWKVAIGRIDEHISHLQKVRDNAFKKALEDNAFVTSAEELKVWMENLNKKTNEDFIDKRMNEVK